jgi:hypothetical protein
MSTVLVTNSNAQYNLNDTTIETVPVDLTTFGLAASQKSAVVSATFSIPPGPQATVLPSWAPTSADYETLLAAEAFTVITEASSTALVGTETSQASLLSTTGAPTTAVITNPGNQPAYVLLGTSSVTVSPTTGVMVAPGASVSLPIASNTYLAYIGATVLQVVLGS